MKNKDIEYLKKHYGERFARLCRELFPTILEYDGLLSKIIFERFDNVPTLYEDIISNKYDFKNYVNYISGIKFNTKKINAKKTPQELMDEAGYILFPECKTEDDIQKFKKYYKSDEELCTFDGDRLLECRVWFAVKKNLKEIKRSKEPDRQDAYGTSVISIQFTREKNPTLSIKNRYNDTVIKADSTFGNNLDNIIEGLTDSFKKYYKIPMNFDYSDSYIPFGYVLANDKKRYKINTGDVIYRINNRGLSDDILCCANNVVVKNNVATKYNKDQYLLANNYLFDLKNNSIKNVFEYETEEEDSFISSVGEIKKISFKFDENDNKVVVITPKIGEDILVTTNNLNQIIGYKNSNVERIGDSFLDEIKTIRQIEMNNLKEVGDNFLKKNTDLEEVILPNLITCGSSFVCENEIVSYLYLPKLRKAGSRFLRSNKKLKTVDLPCLEIVTDDFIDSNLIIESINMPNLEFAGNSYLGCNENLKTIYLPKLKRVGHRFVWYNKILSYIEVPLLECVGDKFLDCNEELTSINLQNLKIAGDDFICFNKKMMYISCPKLKMVGNNFFADNLEIVDINFQNMKEVGDYFFKSNKGAKKVYLPNIEFVGQSFMLRNLEANEVYMPKVKQIKKFFMYNNPNFNAQDILKNNNDEMEFKK